MSDQHDEPELSEFAERMLTSICDLYWEKTGLPPGLTAERARFGMLELIAHGGARIIMHGKSLDDPDAKFEIRLTGQTVH